MDRPSRKTKTVNYCEAKDFDDDEDFAVVKAPPSKKSKEDVTREHKQSSSKSFSQETNTQSSQSQKSRKSLDEKLLNRDLEAAITLSMLNNADGEKEHSHTNKEMKAELPLGENTDPSSLLRSNCSVDGDILGLDKITSENQSKKQKKTEEPKKKEDDDDDYEPKLTPESDDNFSEPDESDEEEFTVKKASKAKKGGKVPKSEKPKTSPAANKAKPPSKPSKSKSTTAASTPMRSPPRAKPAPSRAGSSSTVTSKPSVSVSPAGGRVPKWNPPAQIGKSPAPCQRPAGRSPGQGLRLGLSRHVRVKPLHPSVASH